MTSMTKYDQVWLRMVILPLKELYDKSTKYNIQTKYDDIPLVLMVILPLKEIKDKSTSYNIQTKYDEIIHFSYKMI